MREVEGRAGDGVRRQRAGGAPPPAAGARLRLAVLLAAGLGSAACASRGRPTDTLQATLWMRTSAEYAALAEQAYRAATAALATALADTSWTAALEQHRGYGGLPPAVVVDVDETVVDNSGFEIRTIGAGGEFDPAAWAGWVEEAAATAVPGAAAFLREAVARGVTVLYVTNRDAEQEEATRRNLARLGLPLAPGIDAVLTRGEREGWESDKSSRRAFAAERFRILLLVGDDLNDFLPARLPPDERRALARRYADRWGRAWILLPNPVYGTWHDALFAFRAGLTAEQRHRIRLEAMRDGGPDTTSHLEEAP